MTNRRLLDIRLEELRQDVTKVKNAVSLAARRHQLVQALYQYIDMWGEQSAVSPLRRARTPLSKLSEVLDQAGPDLLMFVEENGIHLDQINRDLETVSTRLRAAQDALREAGAPVELDQRMKDALEKNLATCDGIIWTIDDLKCQLDSNGDIRPLWSKFDELRDGRCEVLFADYVDFLGGLTLRDNHFDERIGDLTDVFLQELGALRLAIPARGPARPSVLDVLMKLGFPEWTLWDVPMAAYEVALKQEASSPVAEWVLPQRLSGRNQAQEAVLFADASAAYLVGPAYACSAVLLFLRPDRRGSDTTPADLDRAHVIFELLHHMQAEGEFAVDVGLVRECWEGAARDLAGSPVPEGMDALNRFVAEIYAKLAGTVATAGFDPTRRESAVEALQPVLVPAGQPPTYTGPVLDLLNAAWSAWLRNLASPGDLEKRALTAWVGPAQPGAGPRGGLGSGRSGHRGRP